MRGFLPDVDLMVGLLHPHHQHFPVAQRWLDAQAEPRSIRICRVVQMGALRTLTKPSIMQGNVKTPAEFWDGWEVAMRDERFAFAGEPAGLEVEWKALCRDLPRGASGNTDVYLAAFAQAADLTLVTFDGGFARFPNLSAEILRPH